MMMEGGSTNQFIGSKISLISKSEIRYEGILYALDLQEATISLAKVRSFGTEDRPTLRPVAPKDETYEFIIFRGSDIKGIDVIEPPQQEDSISVDDPAILEVSHQQQLKQQQVQQPAPPQQQQQQQQHHGNHLQQHQEKSQQPQQAQRNPPAPHPQQQPAHPQQQPQPHPQQQQPPQNYSRYTGRGRGVGIRGIVSPNYRGTNPRGYFRGNYHSGIPAQTRNKIQFEGEFDFEKANEELQLQLSKIKLADPVEDARAEDEGDDEQDEDETFYQKDNFFDNISCEALERQKGKSTRVDWRAERKLNAETFGLPINGRGSYRGNYRGNYRGYSRGNYYYNNNRGGYRGISTRGQPPQQRTVYNRNQTDN